MKCRIIALMVMVGIMSLASTHIEHAWVQKVGLDIWNLGSVCQCERTIMTEREGLEDTSRQLEQRIELCQHIATQVLAGHITLIEGANEVEKLDQYFPGWLESLCTFVYPNTSRREVAARYLINKIDFLMAAQKTRANHIRFSMNLSG